MNETGTPQTVQVTVRMCGMLCLVRWRGPYTAVGLTPITAPESEDPSVFQDPRGNFHLLTNVNNAHKHCASGMVEKKATVVLHIM